MSLQSSRIVKPSIKLSVFLIASFLQVSVKAWDIDFSRRQKDLQRLRTPASAPAETQIEAPENSPLLGSLFKAVSPEQDVVILNTKDGFVPSTLRLRKNQTYKVHIVNVNQDEKNVSFILDAFSEHHGTYYGVVKRFSIHPKVEGIFSFQSPETSKQGQLIIFSDDAKLAAKE